RTAGYGPVRPAVWEGRRRETPPYPDSILSTAPGRHRDHLRICPEPQEGQLTGTAPLHCKFLGVLYADPTFGIFPQHRQQWRGIFLSIQRREAALGPSEILVVERPELRRQPAVIDRPRLVQARHHRLLLLPKCNEPGPPAVLRGGRHDE